MRKLALTLAGVLFAFSLLAQNNIPMPRNLRTNPKTTSTQSANSKLRPFIGGNINSNFGAMMAFALEGGVYITDWFSVGMGPRYEMTIYMDPTMGNYGTRNAFGATAYAQFLLVRYLILHAGYEYLNYPLLNPDFDEYGDLVFRKNYHALALGVGFRSYIAQNLSLYALYIVHPIPQKTDYFSSIVPMSARVGITYEF
jgi:hypothetical protein